MSNPSSLTHNTETHQKTVLVTGATGGIGQVMALELAKLGYRVLMTSRSAAKGQQVLEDIKVQTGNDALELYIGDLSSMSDVRRIALEVRAKHPTLDVLINNAGGIFNERRETVDGFEYTFAFNHLAYFLLTELLLPSLKAAAAETGSARVVSVSSSGNLMGKIKWDDPNFKTGFSIWPVYFQSKLMNVLFANALSRRLSGSGVTSNAVHPGLVASGFGGDSTGFRRVLSRLIRPFSLTTQQGAQTSLYLATSPQVQGISGLYFDKQKPKKTNPVAADQGAQERLWKLSEAILKPWLDEPLTDPAGMR